MKTSKMAPVFEQLSYKLPLQVDAADLPAWLEALNPAETYYSCGKLLRLMKSLHTDSLTAETEFELLNAILSALDRISAKFEKPLLDAGNPVGVSERINAELIIVCYAELAQRFGDVADALAARQPGKGLKKVALALFNGLEALRRALLYIAFLYDRPYDGFWQLGYRLYLCAESHGILAAPTGSNHASVDGSFKSLLVFHLSDPSLLTQREMKALFALFQNRPVSVKIYRQVDEEKMPLVFAFAPESDAPPMLARYAEQPGEQLRYVSTIKVARMAYTLLNDDAGNLDNTDTGNYSLLYKLAKVLSMKASRKLTRVTEQRECLALFGFNNVFNYLTLERGTAHLAGENIPAPSSNFASDVWEIPDLGLVPKGDEDLHRMQHEKKIASLADPKLKNIFNEGSFGPHDPANAAAIDSGRGNWQRFIFEHIAIVNSSAKDYAVVRKELGVPIKIGELLGILNPADERMELGLIRRIAHYEQLDAELGLELISLQACVAAIWKTEQDYVRQPVLYLPRIGALQQSDTILFPGHTYGAGETIFLHYGNHKTVCRIEKLLHVTPVFTHAELSLINNDALN